MSSSEPDPVDRACAEIFRTLNGLALVPGDDSLGDREIIARPIESFDMDSLSVMEYVMAVEDRFEVELDELAVHRCGTIADLAALVRQKAGV